MSIVKPIPKKATMADLFKSGEDFKFKNVDYNSPKAKRDFRRLQKQMEKRQKEIDLMMYETQKELKNPIWFAGQKIPVKRSFIQSILNLFKARKKRAL